MKKAIATLIAALVLFAVVGGAWAAGPYKDTVIFAQGSDVTSLDPHIGKQLRAFTVSSNMFEQIVKFDDKMQVAPSLAKSWERLSPTEIRFKLRDDVKWHNGEPFTADDVKFSYDRMIATPNVANNISFLESSRVEDKYTIVLKTKYPYAPVLAALTTPPCSIVPKKVVEADPKGFALKPVGTGPYKFVEWKPDDYVKLEAWSGYYGEKAETKYVIMKVVPESTQRSIMLETGEIDVAYDIPPSDVARIQKSKSMTLLQGESMKVSDLNINVKSKGPLGNKLVRQAIAYAIDREGIVKHVLSGIGIPGTVSVPPAAFGYNPAIKGSAYDVAKAKALMKQAGFPNGFNCSIWVDDDQVYTEIATVIQNQLSEIGINLKIEVMKQATKQNRLYEKQDFDMNISFFNNLVGDADYNLYSNYHPKSASNNSYYENKEVTDLIIKSREQFKDAERKATFDKIYSILLDEVPSIALYYDKLSVGVTNKVEDFTLNRIGAHKYANVKVKK